MRFLKLIFCLFIPWLSFSQVYTIEENNGDTTFVLSKESYKLIRDSMVKGTAVIKNVFQHDLPDGQWCIYLHGDSVPIYRFNLSNNAVNDTFYKYDIRGRLKVKGRYRKDSTWSFIGLNLLKGYNNFQEGYWTFISYSTEYKVRIDDKGRYPYYRGGRTTKILINEWYSSGVKKYEKRDGYRKEWYEDGQVMYESYYNSDKEVYTSIKWYPNGTKKQLLKRSGKYKKETITKWNDDGSLYAKLRYNKFGKVKRLIVY